MCIVHASQMQAARLARLCVNFEGGRREVDGMGCRIGAGAACLRAAAKIIFAARGLRNTAGLAGGAELLNLSQESATLSVVCNPETYRDSL